MVITRIRARQIIDSRGYPTVEVDLKTPKATYRSSVPSGSSIGVYESLEKRDESTTDYCGKGISSVIDIINNQIAPALVGKDIDVTDQAAIDKILIDLDGTANKKNLGTNALLGVSYAVAKAGASQKGAALYRHIADLAGYSDFILPVPAFNVINGGKHAGNRLAMQSFMILPTGAASFTEAMKMGIEVYHNLKTVLKSKYGYGACNIGDEGGFAPNIQDSNEVLNLIQEAIAAAGYTGKIQIAIDAAATEFFKEGKYDLDFKNPESDPSYRLRAGQLAKIYRGFIENYPVVSIEDGFDQDDWNSWNKMTANVTIQFAGDNLLASNPARVQGAIDNKLCNALVLAPNQIGTVTEAIQASKIAQAAGLSVVVSNRSGETDEIFIADLAVGLGAGQIKSGAPCRSEFLAKYNRLLRIEEEIGSKAKYAGENFRNPVDRQSQ